MVKFISLFITFALIGLVVFGSLSFGIQLQEDNNSTERLTDNTLINKTVGNLRTDMEGFRDKSELQKTLFEEENPTIGFGSLLLFSVISSGKVFTGMTVGLYNIFIGLPTALFGLDPVVSAVFSTLLLVIIILGLWTVYKLGGA